MIMIMVYGCMVVYDFLRKNSLIKFFIGYKKVVKCRTKSCTTIHHTNDCVVARILTKNRVNTAKISDTLLFVSL